MRATPHLCVGESGSVEGDFVFATRDLTIAALHDRCARVRSPSAGLHSVPWRMGRPAKY